MALQVRVKVVRLLGHGGMEGLGKGTGGRRGRGRHISSRRHDARHRGPAQVRTVKGRGSADEDASSWKAAMGRTSDVATTTSSATGESRISCSIECALGNVRGTTVAALDAPAGGSGARVTARGDTSTAKGPHPQFARYSAREPASHPRAFRCSCPHSQTGFRLPGPQRRRGPRVLRQFPAAQTRAQGRGGHERAIQ